MSEELSPSLHGMDEFTGHPRFIQVGQHMMALPNAAKAAKKLGYQPKRGDEVWAYCDFGGVQFFYAGILAGGPIQDIYWEVRLDNRPRHHWTCPIPDIYPRRSWRTGQP